MIKLSEWKRGFFFTPDQAPDRRMYLWFYEWHLFDAFCKGQHTPGRHIPEKSLADDGRSGVLTHDGLQLNATVREDGADLQLTVTNQSTHDWPDIAAIIPCFNPGSVSEVPETESFFDDEHERTWFLGRSSLERLIKRDIHFNHDYRDAIDAEAEDGTYVFSEKWPTSGQDAGGGLLLRESIDGAWVAGIAWESYLSLQGHNPWRCMHQSVRVGPLESGETRKIKGRIYLFDGNRSDCLERYREEYKTDDGS